MAALSIETLQEPQRNLEEKGNPGTIGRFFIKIGLIHFYINNTLFHFTGQMN